MKEVAFLGHIISVTGVFVDPQKIKAIMELPRPTIVPEYRSFMGLGRYYRIFLQDFSKIVMHVTRLVNKMVKFVWSDECQAAF